MRDSYAQAGSNGGQRVGSEHDAACPAVVPAAAGCGDVPSAPATTARWPSMSPGAAQEEGERARREKRHSPSHTACRQQSQAASDLPEGPPRRGARACRRRRNLVWACPHSCTHSHTRSHLCTRTRRRTRNPHTCTHTCTSAHTCGCTHAHAHTYPHLCAHMHIRTRTCTCTPAHVHTHMRMAGCALPAETLLTDHEERTYLQPRVQSQSH